MSMHFLQCTLMFLAYQYVQPLIMGSISTRDFKDRPIYFY